MNWEIDADDEIKRALKKLTKDEHTCLLYNLAVYHESLNISKNPIHIQHGFLHSEPYGIRALDQGGGALPGGKKRPKMKEIRLYTYSDLKSKKLHLLCLGEKKRQTSDIQHAKKRLDRIREASE